MRERVLFYKIHIYLYTGRQIQVEKLISCNAMSCMFKKSCPIVCSKKVIFFLVVRPLPFHSCQCVVQRSAAQAWSLWIILKQNWKVIFCLCVLCVYIRQYEKTKFFYDEIIYGR